MTELVTLAHGGGGKRSQELMERLILPAFGNAVLGELHDGAVMDMNGTRIAFSTDSFVVNPRTFPGGDIGSMAIYGTVNDLAMCGAQPFALSAALIVEDGFGMDELGVILTAMRDAAKRCSAWIVTGDTKVVEAGKADGIYINVTGIGIVRPNVYSAPKRVRPGDAIIVSGRIAEHGLAVLSARHGFGFPIESDSAPLNWMAAELTDACGEDLHAMRDPTRGGLSATLNEIAVSANVGMVLNEAAIPVSPAVVEACAVLGYDPLFIANEGKLVAFVAPEAADKALASLRADKLGLYAARIGTVVDDPGNTSRVLLNKTTGGFRIVCLPVGGEFPRIC